MANRHTVLSASSSGGGGGTSGFILPKRGRLAIESDVADIVMLERPTFATAVTAVVKQAPTGHDATVVITLAGVTWMTLTIIAGTTSIAATALQLSGAAVLTAGDIIGLDLTAVGTTFPGSDLSVLLYT